MFDKLLGKKELEKHIIDLEAQIVELKSKNDSLIARQASKEETARKAISQKQIVEQELNISNKKIETLEYDILNFKKQVKDELNFSNISFISKQSINKYLSRINSFKSEDRGLITITLKNQESLSNQKNSNELLRYLDKDTVSLIDKIDSPTGLVIFYDTDRMVQEILAPYLPVDSSDWQINTGFDIGLPQSLIEQKVTLCIVLAHAGESFIGITQDSNTFLFHSIIRSSVKGKHTKGGWSQRRFEKLRTEDIRHHVEKVGSALKTMITDADNKIDYIIAGGDFKLVSMMLKDFEYSLVKRSFDTSVDKKNIDRILQEVWSCKRYEI
ncbi:MAG: hypothetical protein K8R25_07885 [Methanosarcinales archaeon]|nr:hypothetical protein [Methanosarcinales archaeon]